MKPPTPRSIAAAWGLAVVLLGYAPTAWASVDPMQAQYRIDGANPQPLPLVASDGTRTQYHEATFALDVSAANLSVGPHYLEVRAAGTNGAWSAWQGQWFRVTGSVTLTAAEFFVDSDPGPGHGKPIPSPQDGGWDEAREDLVVPGVTVTNLSTGRHTLFVRSKDSNGDWGLTNATVFYVGDEVTLVAGEWTSNPYAAAGTGFPMALKPATNSVAGDFTLSATNTTLDVGTNYCATYPLYVRVQDSLGRWSTRTGWYLDPAGTTWLFDPDTGWAGAAIPLVVAPEVPSDPVLCDHCLTNKGTLTLSWKECQGITGYELYGRGSIIQPFILWAKGTNNSFSPPTLLASGTYSWMVRSLGGTECYQDGPVWRFTVTDPSAGDTDNDGIPDAWERQYFSALFRANGSTDWDKDGSLDWEEYVHSTIPTNSASFFEIPACRVVPGGVAIDIPTALDRNYTVYYAMDLLDLETVWYVFDQFAGTGTTLSVTNLWPDPHGYFTLSVDVP